MKPFKIKMCMIGLMALMCIGLGTAYAAGFSPGEITNSIAQCDLSPAVLAIAPVVMTALPIFNLENLTVVTQEEFTKLQATHGKLYVLDIMIDKDESYQYIAKRPTRQLLSAIAEHKDDIDAANDLILKNMIVAGDLKALDDGIVYGQLMKEMGALMQHGTSFLSKA